MALTYSTVIGNVDGSSIFRAKIGSSNAASRAEKARNSYEEEEEVRSSGLQGAASVCAWASHFQRVGNG